MGIFQSKYGTANKRAIPAPIETFTDRYDHIKYFVSQINSVEHNHKINFIYGLSGNGKTLLVRFLLTECAKYFKPENWVYLNSLGQEEFVQNVIHAESGTKVAVAYIDLSSKDPFSGDLTDSFFALIKLRNILKKEGIPLHIFDFATIWYLHKTNTLSTEMIKKLYPSEEAGLIAAIVDAITHTAYAKIVNAFIQVLNKQFKEDAFIAYLQQRISSEILSNIQDKNPETELYYDLPEIFAYNLNDVIKNNNELKIVICFDSHDSFWGDKIASMSSNLFYQRDEWLRKLLGHLDLDAGLIVYVTATERPRWKDASIYPIQNEYINFIELNGFSEPDALEYLKTKGIENHKLKEYIIFQSASEIEIHPLCLAMISDLFLQSEVDMTNSDLVVEEILPFNDVLRVKLAVVDTILKHATKDMAVAIYALAAARHFNYDTFKLLGTEVGFSYTAASYETLTAFSFIRESGDGMIVIHDFIRKSITRAGNINTLNALKSLSSHYSAKMSTVNIKDNGSLPTVIDYIYYLNKTNWEAGFEFWHELFHGYLFVGNFLALKLFVDIYKEMTVENIIAKGLAAESIGAFYHQIGKSHDGMAYYAEALKEYKDHLNTENIVGHDFCRIALCYIRIAEADIRMNIPSSACEHFELAILQLNEALRRDPSHFHAYKNLGSAYMGLSTIAYESLDNKRSLDYLDKSIHFHQKAIESEPECAEYYYHYALSLYNLNEYSDKNDKILYADTYNKIVSALGKAVKIQSPFPEALTLLAATYQNMAGFAHKRGLNNNVEFLIKQSIELYDYLLGVSGDFVHIHNNKTASIHLYADVLISKGQFKVAISLLEKQVVEIQKLQHCSPNQPLVLSCLLTLYLRLAAINTKKGRPDKAIKYLESSELVLQGLYSEFEDKMIIDSICTSIENCAKHWIAVNDFSKAGKLYLKAELLCRNMILNNGPQNIYFKSAVLYSNALNNLLTIYVRGHENDQIIKLYDEITDAFNVFCECHPNSNASIVDALARSKFAEVFNSISADDKATEAFVSASDRVSLVRDGDSNPLYWLAKNDIALSVAHFGARSKSEKIDVEAQLNEAYNAAKVLVICAGEDFLSNRLSVTFDFGTYLMDKRSFENANKLFKEIIFIYETTEKVNADTGMEYIYAITLRRFAQIARVISPADDVIQYIVKSLDILESLHKENVFHLGIFYEMAVLYNEFASEQINSDYNGSLKKLNRSKELVLAHLQSNSEDLAAHELYADVLENMAEIQIRMGNQDKALKYGETSIGQLEILLKEAGSFAKVPIQRRIASRLIKISEHRHDKNTCATELNKALKLLEEIIDTDQSAEVYRELCGCLAQISSCQHQIRSEYDLTCQCVRACKDALLIYPDDDKIRKILANTYLQAGGIELELNYDHSSAFNFFKSAYEIAISLCENNNSDSSIWWISATALKSCGEIMYENKDFSESFRFYETAIQAYDLSINFNPHDNPAILMRVNAIRRSGEVSIELEDDVKAYSLLNSAIDLYREIANSKHGDEALNGLAISYLNLSQLDFNKGVFSEAIINAKTSIDIFNDSIKRKVKNTAVPFNLGNAHSLLGIVLRESGDLLGAILSLRQAVDHYKVAIKNCGVHRPAEQNLERATIFLTSLLSEESNRRVDLK
jgi:tetratricopeptide (TPR) repeat protein